MLYRLPGLVIASWDMGQNIRPSLSRQPPPFPLFPTFLSHPLLEFSRNFPNLIMAMMATSNSSAVGANGGHQSNGNSSPLCRCRVLYIGSAVPTVTKDGLQGIQQPLRERYPAGESPDAKGIDSWLSVWYNGLLLEYVDGEQRTESAFFPINTLHYCAAVRYVNMGAFTVEGGGGGERFIPLDSPFAMGAADSPHPPIFAAIFRRTTGVKVLECHGFVCTNEKAANALVRCCFHAYADTMYLKLDEKLPGALTGTGPMKAIKEPPPSSRSVTPSSELNLAGADEHHHGAGNGGVMPLMDGTPDWNERAIGQKQWQRRQQSGEYDAGSVSSSLAKKGGMAGGRPRHHQEMVPYMGGGGGGGAENGGGGYFTSRRTASHAELRSSAQNHPQDFFDASSPYRGPPRHPPGPPFFFGPHPPPPHPFFHPGPPPGLFLRPPPPPGPFPPHPAHFFPPRPGPFPPHGPPPHFGRMIPPPPPPPHPFMMRPPFFMMPPHFMGLHHGPPNFRPKSPERTGGGPIITDYDTFPRHNRTTYEEPIYMPSATNPLPPYASYKPGSFSPEFYEHYYETYKQQNNRGEMERKNVSRSNSDISGDYWESAEQNVYGRKGPQQRMNERAFANTLLANQQQGGGDNNTMTNKMANGNDGGSPMGTAGTRRGMAGGDGTLTKSKPGTSNSTAAPAEGAPGTSNGAGGREPKPDTPPADYELTAAGEMRAQGGHHRMTAY